MQDVFVDGYVDMAIFQSTYLTDLYMEASTPPSATASHCSRSTRTGSSSTAPWDPRDGEAGLEALEENVERVGLKGVKLYTAEWRRGLARVEPRRPEAVAATWRSARSWASRTSTPTRARRSGRWTRTLSTWPTSTTRPPTSRTSTSSSSTSGMPRIEDFCCMAVQEPNVYGGLAVVIGALMHARPKFFAKVHGRAAVLGRRGQADLRQRLRHLAPEVAGRGLRRLATARATTHSPTIQLTTATKKKILGLNAAKLYDIEVPAEFQLAGRGRRLRPPRTPQLGSVDRRRGTGVTARRRGTGRARHGARPRAGRAVTSLGFVDFVRRVGGGGGDVRLRLPTYFCAPNFAFLMVADAHDAVSARARAFGGRRSMLEDHFASDEINGGVAARAGFVQSFDGQAEAELDELRRISSARRCWPPRPGLPAAARGGTRRRTSSPCSPSATCPRRRTGNGSARAGPSWACRRATTRRCWWIRAAARRSASRRCPCTSARPADRDQPAGQRRSAAAGCCASATRPSELARRRTDEGCPLARLPSAARGRGGAGADRDRVRST